jgi:beta-lactamase regulating signal transducer with metallopeptidase domain
MEILMNWLWQGVAVALAAAVLLGITRRRVSATTRHHILWAALAVVLLLPLLPLVEGAIAFERTAAAAGVPVVASSATAVISDRVIPVPTIVLPSLPAWSTLLFLLVCSSYTTLSGLRIIAGLRSLGRIKGMARPFPECREADLKAWLAVRARGRAARLVISDEVRAAAVLGLGSPMIAVAPSALAALSADELDHIVMHEWAHVQRRDDIAQLAQRIVVALTGLHPAVWWIDRQLRLERETACDDWAVNAKGSPKGLALCLTKLASLPRRHSDPSLMPSALSASELTTRVVRLLDGRRNTSTARRLGLPAAAALGLFTWGVGLSAVQLIATETVSAAADRAPRADASHPAQAAAAAASRKATIAAIPDVNPVGTTLRASEFRERPRPSRAPQPRSVAQNTPQLRGIDEALRRTAPESSAGRDAIPVTHGVGQFEMRIEHQPQAAQLPGHDDSVAVTGSSNTPEGQQARMTTPWGVAADAGVNVGKGSQKAAVTTAGFFSRFGKSMAKVF